MFCLWERNWLTLWSVQDRFQRFSLYFKSIFHEMIQVFCITQKIRIFEYINITFLEDSAFLCRETFWSISKFFQYIITSPSNRYHSTCCMDLYTKLKINTFDPIGCGNADTASFFQIMSYTHKEKDLTKNEHLNLNIENKILH